MTPRERAEALWTLVRREVVGGVITHHEPPTVEQVAAAIAEAISDFAAVVDARAQADQLAGNPIQGMHYRAMVAELAAFGLSPLPVREGLTVAVGCDQRIRQEREACAVIAEGYSELLAKDLNPMFRMLTPQQTAELICEEIRARSEAAK